MTGESTTRALVRLLVVRNIRDCPLSLLSPRKEVGRPDGNLKDPVKPLGTVVGIVPGHGRGPYTSDMKGQTRPFPTLAWSSRGDIASCLHK